MCLFKMKKKKRADNFGNLSSKCQCFKTFCYIAPWMMLVSTLWIFIIHGRELHHYWLYVRNYMKIFSLFRSIEEPVDQIFCSKVDKITLPAEIYLFLQKPKGRKHFRANIFLILWCRHILFIGLSNILSSPDILWKWDEIQETDSPSKENLLFISLDLSQCLESIHRCWSLKYIKLLYFLWIIK